MTEATAKSSVIPRGTARIQCVPQSSEMVCVSVVAGTFQTSWMIWAIGFSAKIRAHLSGTSEIG